MSVLASLVRAYDRMAARGEVPAFGYSQEKIGFVISAQCRWDASRTRRSICGVAKERGRRRSLMPVPQPSKRTSGIAPNFLWDKTRLCAGRDSRRRKRTSLRA